VKLISIPAASEKHNIPKPALYHAADQDFFGVPDIVVRFGRSVWLNEKKLEEFINSGGKAWPGGWRREPAEQQVASAIA
jgi:hypothetical protein